MKNTLRAFLVLVALAGAVPAWSGEKIGKVLAVKGDVKAVAADGTERSKLSLSSPIYANEKIYTGENAKVQIMFSDKSLYTIGQNAEVILDEYVYNPETGDGKSIIEVTKGIFRFLTGDIAKKDPEKVKVNTPFATIGVRGSGGIVNVEPTGQTTLNMTECCLNISQRGNNAPPVQLTQVNTFSRVTPAGEVSQPEPAPIDMLMKLQGAVDLKDASRLDEAPVEKKSEAQKPKKKTLKALVKTKQSDGQLLSEGEEGENQSSEEQQAQNEGGNNDVDGTQPPALQAGSADEGEGVSLNNTPDGNDNVGTESGDDNSLLSTFGSGGGDNFDGELDSGDGFEGDGQPMAGDPAAGTNNVTDSQQQQAVEDTFGGNNKASLSDFGEVLSGTWKRQDREGINERSGSLNVALKEDVKTLIVERFDSTGNYIDRMSFDAPAEKGRAKTSEHPQLLGSFVYRGLNDNFYYVSSNFGRNLNLGQIVAGSSGVLNSGNQGQQLGGQRLYFNFLPDTFTGLDQFVDFNLADGVSNPLRGSGFEGERRHEGAGLIFDYTNNNAQFLGGHVNLSYDPLKGTYNDSFKFMVGEIEGSGSNALTGSIYSLTNDSFGGGVGYESGALTANENEIYGDINTSTAQAEIDAYKLNLGTETAYAVNTGASDNLSVNSTSGAQTLKGFSSGFVVLDTENAPTAVRLGNNDMLGVQMTRQDHTGSGTSFETVISLNKIDTNGDMGSAPADNFKVSFGGAGADSAYISHNVYGAEESQSGSGYDIGSNYDTFSGNPADVNGAMLSSYFIDMPDRPEIEETCQDCQYLTWGVWAADIDINGEIATAQIVPYVTGREYQTWDNITGNGVTNASYKGVLVGSVTNNGSDVRHDVGVYTADVDFSNRKIGFDGQFAGYHFYDSNVVTGAAGSNYGFKEVKLDNLKNNLGVDVGDATISGAFYGASAEEMGGTFNFKHGTVEAAGIYAGKKQ